MNPGLKLTCPSLLNNRQHFKSSSIILLVLVHIPTVPDQVPNLAVQPSKSSNGLISLNVTWGEPHSDVTITRYESNYRIQSDGSWKRGLSQPASSRQRVYRSLRSGVNFEIRVRAVSPIGAGEYKSANAASMLLTECVLSCSMTQRDLHFSRIQG